MSLPINAEERIGKWVGRRKLADPFASAMKLQRTVNLLQGHLQGLPRGVFRFRTHEEADKWLLEWMNRRRPKS